MTRPDSRVLFFIGVLALMMLAWGCSQSDNITATVNLTNVWLKAQRLPTPPPGMAYELWASKTAVTDTSVATDQLTSLGKFLYVNNDTLVAFLDTNGQVRPDSNKFVLNADMFDYATLFVTIEQMPDPTPQRPGPIMLLQNIMGNTDTLRMIFPLSEGFENLWGKSVQYNLQSVSDTDRFALNGYGIWFSQYEYNRVPFPDTLDLFLSFKEDTITAQIDSVSGDTLNKNLLGQLYRDTTFKAVDTVYRLFGDDTLTLENPGEIQHITVVLTDSLSPRDSFPIIYYDLELDSAQTVDKSVNVDIYHQTDSLPVYTDWGWKYQGWIVSQSINPAAVGELTPPAWQIVWLQDVRLPGYQGGLLTTGKFSRINAPDDSNPFTLKTIDRIDSTTTPGVVDTIYQRPRIPGEDFLDGAALAAATHGIYSSPVRLLPSAGDSASVFISLEPANKPAALDSTNFPLIPLVGRLPNTWNFPTGVNDTATVRQEKMRNWVQNVNHDYMGFPEVTARLLRQ